MKKGFVLSFLAALMIISACNTKVPETPSTGLRSDGSVAVPEWVKSAVVYEVNIRQFSAEGNLKAVQDALPRLSTLGVDILWLMPVHPIGEVNRKGSLGSYYSVKDYKAVNPEYGTLDDFKQLVEAAHLQGMKIIIDWVPNHSSWDNPLAAEHPEWYLKTDSGSFKSPFDWTDVIQFDYNQRGLRDYMIETMKWWLSETNIDGFRCDVAHMVPVDFWDELRPALYSVKEVFLLAEADQPFLHAKAFDASYDWRMHHIMNELAKGNKTAADVVDHLAYVDSAYPANPILMQFTSNHDENSWNGTEYERLGQAVKSFAALSFVLPGIPLIYNGQEACLQKRLLFFEKDPISWADCDMAHFYQMLGKLRDNNIALHSGVAGGSIEIINTNQGNKVLAFRRVKDYNRVIALFNFTGETLDCAMEGINDGAQFTDYFTKIKVDELNKNPLKLDPWAFQIFVQE